LNTNEPAPLYSQTNASIALLLLAGANGSGSLVLSALMAAEEVGKSLLG
jgi:hypothetical protein